MDGELPIILFGLELQMHDDFLSFERQTSVEEKVQITKDSDSSHGSHPKGT